MSGDTTRFTDEDLSAFLDGEVDDALSEQITEAVARDAALAARLEALAAPAEAIRNALKLDAIGAPSMPDHLRSGTSVSRAKMLVPLGLAASFVLGLAVSNFMQRPPDWVDMVASYQALYVTDTLSGPQQDEAQASLVFAKAQEALGIDLRGRTAISGLTFRRIQMLGIEGAPLVQIAYVDADGMPFAFCITKVAADDSDFETELNHQLATTSWVDNGLGFVLIGGTDQGFVADRAEAMSEVL